MNENENMVLRGEFYPETIDETLIALFAAKSLDEVRDIFMRSKFKYNKYVYRHAMNCGIEYAEIPEPSEEMTTFWFTFVVDALQFYKTLPTHTEQICKCLVYESRDTHELIKRLSHLDTWSQGTIYSILFKCHHYSQLIKYISPPHKIFDDPGTRLFFIMQLATRRWIDPTFKNKYLPRMNFIESLMMISSSVDYVLGIDLWGCTFTTDPIFRACLLAVGFSFEANSFLEMYTLRKTSSEYIWPHTNPDDILIHKFFSDPENSKHLLTFYQSLSDVNKRSEYVQICILSRIHHDQYRFWIDQFKQTEISPKVCMFLICKWPRCIKEFVEIPELVHLAVVISSNIGTSIGVMIDDIGIERLSVHDHAVHRGKNLFGRYDGNDALMREYLIVDKQTAILGSLSDYEQVIDTLNRKYDRSLFFLPEN